MAAGKSANNINEKSFFSGRFHLNGDLNIDGKYEGSDLKADSLTVGRAGRIKSEIEVNQLVVEGIIVGNIRANVRVMLLPSAKILGDITTPELIVQNGVIFEGKCRIINNLKSSARNAVLKAYKD